MQGEGPSAEDSRRRSFKRSDEEIIDQLKRNDRAGRFMILGFLVSLISSVVLVLMGRFGAVPRVVAEYLAAAPLIVWVLATIFLFGRQFAPAPEADEERILRRRIDSIQSRWRWIIVVAVFTAFTTTFSTSFALGRPNIRYPLLAPFAGASLAVVILCASQLAALLWSPAARAATHSDCRRANFRSAPARARLQGRISCDDDHGCRRASGVSCIKSPRLTGPALCWLLFAGFAIPTLYYVILQWRAGAGE